MKILKYPHPILRQVCDPVINFDKGLRKQIKYMYKLMNMEQGLGLAAPQVGIPLRFFIVEDQVYINPRVTEKKGIHAHAREGCLSIPGVYKSIYRPREIAIEFQNVRGNTIRERHIGSLSVMLMHELDHLDGKLIVDYR